MSKFSIFVFASLLVIALLCTKWAITANKENIPYLGKWSGKFEAQRFAGKPEAFSLERYSMTGFVQLYKTGEKFVLHLEGEQEMVDVRGTWTARGDEIRFKVINVEIDDMGGVDMRDPNRVFLEATALRGSLSQPFVLRMSKDKKRLTGLPTTLVNVVGTYAFIKDLQ